MILIQFPTLCVDSFLNTNTEFVQAPSRFAATLPVARLYIWRLQLRSNSKEPVKIFLGVNFDVGKCQGCAYEDTARTCLEWGG